MAALLEGQQYGLSAQDKINSNKSLVFVKLTDSALRSIEEYVKNKGDTISRPTIQFQNSNGVIRLPQNGNCQTYSFTLSNVEADGPHGSFECLRQTGHRSLESLGCLDMKMHIHANEDSYENTRVKMAAAEQEHKKSCTKEIKPAGAHLGRKVKVKRPGLVLSSVKPNSPPTSSLAITKNPVKVVNNGSAGISNISLPKKPDPQKFARVASKNKFANSPELLRQPIRDRIIHILAVRPYKKPELLVRLMNEGIREKDRKGIAAVISQVGVLKGNIYNLANYMWNEVQDNWKFCTQEELDIIRKRKQQILNANNENDVPSPNNQLSNSPTQKRPAYEMTGSNQEPRSKKQRISHYSRPEAASHSVKTEPLEYNTNEKFHSTVAINRKSQCSPVTMQSSLNGCSPENDSAQKSPVDIASDSYPNLSQKSATINYTDDMVSSSSLNQRSCTREDSEKNIRSHASGLSQRGGPSMDTEKSFRKEQLAAKNSRFEMDDSSRQRPSSFYPKGYVNNGEKSQNHPQLSHSRSLNLICNPTAQVSPDSNGHYQGKELKNDPCPKTVSNGYVNNSIKTNCNSQSSYINRSKVTSTTNGSCSNSPHSSSDSRDSMDCNSSELQVPPPTTESPPQFDCPDYMKEYGTIESREQRARYKADFNAQYEEYLHLHSKIKGISRKFAHLEHNLHTCEEGSEDFKRIKSRIYKEYRAYQQDPNYIDALKKFNFLHCKLSHIKRLVMDYDNSQCVKS
ncbi:RNA polymerase II elongation factor ELL-like [Stegodyphus dumicola]|nr:RNA polymerase II elongation factor ELL-like [Stegodyphus dumicola]